MPERDVLQADLLIVGGGPAGLAAAIHFRRLLERARAESPAVPDLSVLLLEKGASLGAHVISGAVLDRAGLDAILPPTETARGLGFVPCRISRHEYLTRGRCLPLPWVPSQLRDDGQTIISLNALVRWMGAEAEALGVEIATGFAGVTPLLEGRRVVGVRTGDRGRSRSGQPRPDFSAGADVRARLTVLAEGARGSVTGQVVRGLDLDSDRQRPVYALGFKEVWEVPAGRIEAGTSLHFLGYPLRGDTYGGGFAYAHTDRQVSVGLVVGLDYRDPRLDPFACFQNLKMHPRVRRLLQGGRALQFGARTLNEGGWYALPRPFAEGLLLAGEGAGYLDTLRLKGIHLALRSGMLAAETALEALLAGDVGARRLAAYERLIHGSDVGRALKRARNVRQGFRFGRAAGVVNAALLALTRGRGLKDPLAPSEGAARMRRTGTRGAPEPPPERALGEPSASLAFDRATSLARSGTTHDEDQPPHLLVKEPEICLTRCASEYGQPCERFCPAGVYEIERQAGGRGTRLLIHAANCLHCKTCEIMDPYQIIEWVPPEGGGGPRYEDT